MGFSDTLQILEPTTQQETPPIQAALQTSSPASSGGFSATLTPLDNDFTTQEITSLADALGGKGTSPFAEAVPRSKKELKIAAKKAITVGQVGVAFNPATAVLSPASEGIGQFAKKLIDGGSIKDALKEGFKGAGIDLAIRGATFGLFGTRAKKALAVILRRAPKEIEHKLSKDILKAALQDSGFSQEVRTELVNNSEKFLRPALKTTIDKISKQVGAKVADQRKVLGKAVESANDAVSQVSLGPTKELLDSVKSVVTDTLKDVPATSQAGIRGRATLNTVFKSKKIAEDITHSEFLKRVKEFEASPVMDKIFKALSKDGPGALNSGERALMGLGRKLKNIGDEAIENKELRDELLQSRENFHKFRKSMTDAGLSDRKEVVHNVGKIAKKAVLQTETATRENLRALEELTPNSGPLFDKLLGRVVWDAFKVFTAADANFGRAITAGVMKSAKTVIAPVTLEGKALGLALGAVGPTARRTAVSAFADTRETESDLFLERQQLRRN